MVTWECFAIPSQRAFEGAFSDGEIQAAIVGGIRPVLKLVPELVEGINVRKIIANCWKQGNTIVAVVFILFILFGLPIGSLCL